jgi:hypothetical protein
MVFYLEQPTAGSSRFKLHVIITKFSCKPQGKIAANESSMGHTPGDKKSPAKDNGFAIENSTSEHNNFSMNSAIICKKTVTQTYGLKFLM